jgi:hypothetical protein
MADVPLQVISENSSSERRITPSWTVSQLKAKLEPITGIPPSSQTVFLKTSANERVPIAAADEDGTRLTNFPLSAYAELHVSEALAQCLSVFDPGSWDWVVLLRRYHKIDQKKINLPTASRHSLGRSQTCDPRAAGGLAGSTAASEPAGA